MVKYCDLAICDSVNGRISMRERKGLKAMQKAGAADV